MPQKELIFNEVLNGFNEDIILSNKPAALLDAVNVDMEKQGGVLRKRKGYQRFSGQIAAGKNVLAFDEFTKSDGTVVVLAVVNESIAITNASYATPTVTLTVGAAHGLVAGDVIVVSGLAPAEYNGTFTITTVGATTVSYSLVGAGALSDTTGAAECSSMFYESGGSWVVARRGFKKDAVGQFEHLVGKVFYTDNNLFLNSSDGITWNTATNVLTSIDATSITSANPNVTITLPSGTGFVVGDTFTLGAISKTIATTNVTYVDPTVTVTIASGHGLQPGNVVTLAGFDTAYNGDKTVLTVASTSFTFSSAGLAQPVNKVGTVTITEANRFINITNVVYATPLVTLTVPTGHGFLAGDIITISDLQAEYNGTWTLTSVAATSLVFSQAGLPAVTDTAGKFIGKQFVGTNAVKTVKSIGANTIVFEEAGIPAGIWTTSYSQVVSTLTAQFSLPAVDILEYSNVLFLVGLKGYPSDFMYSTVPAKNASLVYTIGWSRYNNATIETGNGEPLIGAVTYRGAIYFFKNSSIQRSLYPIAANGLKILSKNIGATSKQNLLVVGGYLTFFNEGNRNAKKGFYTYDSLSDSEPQIISEPIQHYIDGMAAGFSPISGAYNELVISYIGAVSNPEYGISMTHCCVVFNTKTQKWQGAYDFGRAITYMKPITVSNVVYLSFGDTDGNIWNFGRSQRDGYINGGSTGIPVQMRALTHNYDLSKAMGEKYRTNYKQRKIQNIWLYGDSLEGVKLRYRFNSSPQQKIEGWHESGDFKSPVGVLPAVKHDAYLFQIELMHTGDVQDNPVIRKVVFEYE